MFTRSLQQPLHLALKDFPVVGLIGSRQVGKTTLARQIARALPAGSAMYLDLELPSVLARLSGRG